MMDEIEELSSLADECREWEAEVRHRGAASEVRTADEFQRIARKLDEIASKLAARMPT